MKKETTANGQTEGPSRKRYLVLAVAALALLALALTVCTCIVSDEDSSAAVEHLYDGKKYAMDFEVQGNVMTITATNEEYYGKVSLAELTDSEKNSYPWTDNLYQTSVTEVKIIGFTGGDNILFSDFTELETMQGNVYAMDAGTSIPVGTQIGTWEYEFNNKALTVSTIDPYGNTSMPNYLSKNIYIPWAIVPTLAQTVSVNIEGFANCGWQAFIGITVDDKVELTIEGDIYVMNSESVYVNSGYWQFTKSTGELKIVYEPETGKRLEKLGTMPTWELNASSGKDNRPWSHGMKYAGCDDWEWYQYVTSVKNIGFADFSANAYYGMDNALIASVGDVYENADDTGTRTGEWSYIIRAPEDYRLGITTGSLMIESFLKLDTWDTPRETLPQWSTGSSVGKESAPWHRLGYSWEYEVEKVYLLNYDGTWDGFAYMTSDTRVYTTWYIDSEDHETIIGEWSFDHTKGELTATAYIADTEMPNWSALFVDDQRPWGRYTWEDPTDPSKWTAERVSIIKVAMFSNISDNAFLGFEPDEMVIVGEILSSAGVKNGEWQYNDKDLILTLKGDDGAVMKDYTQTDKAPWSRLNVDTIGTVIVEGYINVGTYAFYGFDTLKTVKLESVETIDKSKTFYDVTDTVEVIVLNAVTTIPEMFGKFPKLRSFSSESLTSLVKDAFNGSKTLESFSAPEVKTIYQRAFQGCTALKTVTTNEAVTIQANAFENCTSLVSMNSDEELIYLPMVKQIDSYAFKASGIKSVFIGNITKYGQGEKMWSDYIFANCTSLKTFRSDSVTNARTNMFSGCQDTLEHFEATAMTTTDGFNLKNFKSLETLILPQVTWICQSAFENCVSLKKVVLPDSDSGIKCRIYYYAFKNCTSLNDINLERVYFDSSEAFRGCTSLTLKCVNSLTDACGTIGDSTFYGCTGIEGVVVLNHTGSIGNYAFQGCTGITGVDIADNKSNGTCLYYRAFMDCSLLEWINLPQKYTYIGQQAFLNCPLLKHVEVPGSTIDAENIKAQEEYEAAVERGEIDPEDESLKPVRKNTLPDSCTSVNSEAFRGTLLENMYITSAATTTISSHAFRDCKQLTTVTWVSVTALGEYAFAYCTNLTTLTTGSTALDSIGSYTFTETGLTSMSLNCAVINSYAFQKCTSLTSISLSKTTTIGGYCFNGCTALETVEANKLTSIGNYSFYGCKYLTYLNLKHVTSIGEYACQNCESLQLTQPGNDEPDKFEDVTSIGRNAFAYCFKLEALDAPLCTSIGESAFYTAKIKSVNLPSLETLGNNVFYGCTDLKSANLSKVQLIPYRAFFGCTGLQRLALSNDSGFIVNIGTEAFSGCTNLVGEDFELNSEDEPINITPVYLKNVVSFGSYSFYNCYRITDITADSATTVADRAFGYCKALVNASLNAAQSIGYECFISDTSLKTVSIVAAEKINARAFISCTALTKVDARAVNYIEYYAFYDCKNLKTIGATDNVADLTNVTYIRYTAFYNTGVEEFKFGTVLNTIEDQVFRYTHCESFILPDSLVYIGNWQFSGNYTREIVYPSSMSTIREYQLVYCSLMDTSKAVEIYFNEQVQNMGISKSTPLFHFSTSVTIQVHIHMAEGSDVKKMTFGGSYYKVTYYYSPLASYYISTGPSSVSTETSPDYQQVSAIDGSQIVLPYASDSDGLREEQYFGVAGSSVAETYLGIPKAGEESSFTTYVSSGQCMHTYVQATDQMIYVIGNVYDTVYGAESTYSKSIEIVNTAELPEGASIEPEKRSYSYGASVVIPTIKPNTYIVSYVNGLYTPEGGEPVSISLPTKGTFNLGCYLTSMEVGIADHTLTTTFVDGEETFTKEYIFGQTYGEGGGLPGGNPEPGYKFEGWNTSQDGHGNMITDDMTVKKKQTLYAIYKPVEYTVTLYSDSPEYETERTVSGKYTIYNEEGILYYTDLSTTEKTVLYDPSTELPGYKISNYWVGSKKIADGGKLEDNCADLEILVTWKVINYKLEFTFVNNSSGSSALNDVYIYNLLHGHASNLYDDGDIIENIEYSELAEGYVITIPKHDAATFVNAIAVYEEGAVKTKEIEQDESRDCQMVVTYDEFFTDGLETLKIQFNFETGVYRTQFVYNDDNNKVVDSKSLIRGVGSEPITTLSTPNSKSGYTFKCWSLGEGDEHPADTDVEITEDLLKYAKQGMLVFEAIWETKTYTVHYNLGEYTEGTKGSEEITFDSKFTPSTVSGYLGHSLVAWAWIKEDGSGQSASITAGTEIKLTKDIVDTYAYGKSKLDLTLLAIWDLREYTVYTTESASPRFEEIKVKYTESFTLWDGTTARVPEGKSDCEFGQWLVDSQPYGNMATVVIDDTLAKIGDSNEGKLKFVISWIQTEYMVRYDFCDGTDPSGELPTGQMGPYKIGDAFEPVNGSALVKDGYTYDGWKLLETDFTPYPFTSGTFDAAIATYADSDNVVTLYANWEQIKFKITYELEGGTRGEYAPTTATYGTEILISNPTKSGYTFQGWTATNLSTQTVVKVGDNWQRWDGTYAITYTQFKNLCTTANGTVTFTANWSTLEYELKYQPNCDNYTLGEKTEKVKVGEKIILPSITGNVRTGYSWKGWGFDEYNTIESGIEFTSSMTSYAVNNTITIYGVWEPVRYTISYTYYTEYGERTVNAEYGVAVKIPTIDRIGYTFLGWTSTDIDSSTSYYSNDQIIWYKWDGSTANGSYFKNLTSVESGNVSMTGVWQENIYKLVYSANATSAKDPIDDTEYKIGSPVSLVKTIEGSNNGKTFLGWTLQQGSTDIASFTEFTTTVASYADVTNSVHLYGVWSEGTYTVTVDLQGCTPSAIPAGWTLTSSGVYTKQFDYNTKMDVVMEEWSKITLTKDGYVFTSWEYSNASVVADTLVTAKFTEVQQDMLYIFIGVIAAALLIVVIFTRVER